MKVAVTLIFTLLFCSCYTHSPIPKGEENSVSNNYIIFGHFYGFCGGEECIEIFKVTDHKLFEDTHDFYPKSETAYKGNFIPLEQFKFDRVKDIDLQIPPKLFNETKVVIGAPDAADGGGIYLETSDGRYWLLDMNPQYLPQYLHPLREQIRKAIDQINQ